MEALRESPAVERTRRFYEWEIRGRGWDFYCYPVALEPPFCPFFWRRPPSPPQDDAKKPTLLSSFVERLAPPAIETEGEEDGELAPEPLREVNERQELRLLLPPELRAGRQEAEGWLAALPELFAPAAFEIVGRPGAVTFHLALDPRDVPSVLAPLHGYLPEVEPAEEPEVLEETLGNETSVVEFGLAREWMVPLAMHERFTTDPLTGLCSALGALAHGEGAVLQLLFAPAIAPWPESAWRAVHTPMGEPFFVDAPEITKLAELKLSSALFAVSLRLAVSAPSEERRWEVLRSLAGGLSLFAEPQRNDFLPLPAPEDLDLLGDFLARVTHRTGMLLSLDELVGLVHLPSESLRLPAIVRERTKTKEAPAEVLEAGIPIGENVHRGTRQSVGLSEEIRLRHVHVVGASGTGKSTLLVRMILEDIERGAGVAVIDPHGDLVEEIAVRLPAERLSDTVFLDPTDERAAVGVNLLAAHSEVEREILSSDLVAVFRRLSTSWGDQMTAVLGNAVLAFLDSGEGGTLLDLRRFLAERDFRERYLEGVSDPYLRDFFRSEFPRLHGKPEVSVLSRLDTFLRSRMVRGVLTARRPLDLRSLVDSGGIFLAKLSQGLIGEENAALLGSLLVSKIHQVTLSRAELAERGRRPFFLYVDEFHEVATPSMASLFSGARKFALGVTVAHQDLFQLHSRAPDVERSVLANAGTRIVFRVGEKDARALAEGFSAFDAEDLGNLAVGEAIVRIGRREDDFNLRTKVLHRVSEANAGAQREELRSLMRERFPREEASPVTPAPRPIPPPAPREEDSWAETAPERQPAEPRLDKSLLDYLELVAREPFLGVRERNEKLGISASKGHRLKEELVSAGLIREVAVNPGGRGERFKLSELTPDGRKVLGSFGVRPEVGFGRGGVAHQWWVRAIATYLSEKGVSVRVEDDSRGARVDVSFVTSKGNIAIEVETSDGHALENVRKDLAAGYSEVVVLADGEDSAERIREKIADDPRVTVGSLQEQESVLSALLGGLTSSLRPPNEKEEPRRSPKKIRPARPGREAVRGPTESTSPLYPPGVLGTPEAAAYVGLSPATLETMRSRGGGPPFAKLGARVVYRPEDLDEWLEKRLRRSTSDDGESA